MCIKRHWHCFVYQREMKEQEPDIVGVPFGQFDALRLDMAPYAVEILRQDSSYYYVSVAPIEPIDKSQDWTRMKERQGHFHAHSCVSQEKPDGPWELVEYPHLQRGIGNRMFYSNPDWYMRVIAPKPRDLQETWKLMQRPTPADSPGGVWPNGELAPMTVMQRWEQVKGHVPPAYVAVDETPAVDTSGELRQDETEGWDESSTSEEEAAVSYWKEKENEWHAKRGDPRGGS